jgi:tRNA(Ile2) C34 agmatinyltransferase TiaS
MTVAAPSATRRRPAARRRLNEAAHSERSLGGGRLTLERKLQSVWEGLSATGAATCPVCDGEMKSEGGAGRCTGCGSRLG